MPYTTRREKGLLAIQWSKQPMLNGVLHHFGQRSHAHLGKDACLVRADRLGAQVQEVCNFSD